MLTINEWKGVATLFHTIQRVFNDIQFSVYEFSGFLSVKCEIHEGATSTIYGARKHIPLYQISYARHPEFWELQAKDILDTLKEEINGTD